MNISDVYLIEKDGKITLATNCYTEMLHPVAELFCLCYGVPIEESLQFWYYQMEVGKHEI